MNNVDILNQDAETDKQKLFDSNDQTTFKNLVFLRNKEFVDSLKFDIKLIRPDELLKYFITEEDIEEYQKSQILEKHTTILEFLNAKHLYSETGEKVIKDDYFIRFFFNYNYSIATFRKKLRAREFRNPQLQDFLNRIESNSSHFQIQ